MTAPSSIKSCSENSLLPIFSHLYIEEELFHEPWAARVEQIKSRFKKAEVVPIHHFTELVARRSSDWNAQKRSPKLVLAKKTGELVYPCSDVAPSFGHPNFYYAVPMQNCLYDCEYCYLQGMYTSANLVLFVNQQEMIKRTLQLQEELGEIYLCIAYDNDILAMESLLGITAEWVEGLRDAESVTVEVRTKSANFHALKAVAAPTNFILAWTLSPRDVAERFEARTPNLEARLKSVSQALEAGWRVRLCFDPLLPVKDWKSSYGQLLKRLDDLEIWNKIEDSSYGLFRMPKQLLRQAKKARPDSALLHAARDREDERGLFILSGTDQDQLLEFMGRELRARMGSKRVWET